jgi:hypothetical protein
MISTIAFILNYAHHRTSSNLNMTKIMDNQINHDYVKQNHRGHDHGATITTTAGRSTTTTNSRSTTTSQHHSLSPSLLHDLNYVNSHHSVSITFIHLRPLSWPGSPQQ